MRILLLSLVWLGLAGCASSGPTAAENEAVHMDQVFESGMNDVLDCLNIVQNKHATEALAQDIWQRGPSEMPISYLRNSGQLSSVQKASFEALHNSRKLCLRDFANELISIVPDFAEIHDAYTRLTDQAAIALLDDRITAGQYNHAISVIVGTMDEAWAATINEVLESLEERHSAELVERERQRQLAYARFQNGIMNAARVLNAGQTTFNSGAATGGGAFLTGQETSGMNRICYYNGVTGSSAMTIGATQLCPLSK